MNELASLYPCAAILSPPVLTYLPHRSFFAGDIGKLVLPEGIQVLALYGCSGLTGDIGTLVLPEGMQKLNLYGCSGLTGDIGTLVLSEGMRHLDLNECWGLTGKAKG